MPSHCHPSPLTDSIQQPVEIGRHAPPSLPDVESVRNSMPWNVLVSSHAGSARPAAFTSSIGAAFGGFDPALGPPSAIRGSRLISASPLFGRGKQGATRYSSLEISEPARNSGEFDDDSFQLPDLGDEEFELHGPAAGVSTQQANNSQWLANTLEDESNNFFAFLQAEIERRDLDESKDVGVVMFEELLPPVRNSKVVGAQGLLHVLTLVTKGAVVVRQEEDFGRIELSVVPGVTLVERERDEGEREIEARGLDGDLEEQEPEEVLEGGEEGEEDEEDEDMYD